MQFNDLHAKGTTNSYETYEKFIESALGIPFEAEHIARVKLSKQDIYALIDASDRYTQQFMPDGNIHFPAKPESEFRSAVFKHYRAVNDGHTVQPTHLLSIDLNKEISISLLFSHSVLIGVPIFVWPRGSMEQYAEEFISRTKQDLMDLSPYVNLIRKRIIIPLPAELVISGDFNNPLTMPYGQIKLVPDLEDLVKKVRYELANRAHTPEQELDTNVIRALMKQAEIEERYFSYNATFKNTVDAEAYAQLIRESERMSANEFIEPICMSYLHSGISLDHSKLSLSDIINIRLEDELFAYWRNELRQLLHNIHSTRSISTDISRDFFDRVTHSERKWKEEVRKIAGGGVLHDLFCDRKDVIIGMASGVAAGAIVDEATIGPIMTAAAAILFRLFYVFNEPATRHGSRRALRNHFAVIGGDVR